MIRAYTKEENIEVRVSRTLAPTSRDISKGRRKSPHVLQVGSSRSGYCQRVVFNRPTVLERVWRLSTAGRRRKETSLHNIHEPHPPWQPPPPIQTLYRGVLYRSRLEARWSCFFTELGIKFHYEPEVFHTSPTRGYLPDFFLDDVRTWAEVKPVEFSPVEVRKLESVTDQTKRPALMLVGPPAFKTYPLIYARDIDIVDNMISTALLDIHDHHGGKQYRKGRLFSECQTDWWFDASHFSPEYKAAVFAALTNRFNEGGRW